MYRFVDRPIADLESDRLLLLRAMRVWVLAAHQRRCPCRTLNGWFADAGMNGATAHFAIMMAALHRDATERLTFGRPDRQAVTEDEAVLLAIIDRAADPARLRAVASALVKPEAARLFEKALSAVAAALAASPTLNPERFPRDTGDML